MLYPYFLKYQKCIYNVSIRANIWISEDQY